MHKGNQHIDNLMVKLSEFKLQAIKSYFCQWHHWFVSRKESGSCLKKNPLLTNQALDTLTILAGRSEPIRVTFSRTEACGAVTHRIVHTMTEVLAVITKPSGQRTWSYTCDIERNGTIELVSSMYLNAHRAILNKIMIIIAPIVRTSPGTSEVALAYFKFNVLCLNGMKMVPMGRQNICVYIWD